MATTEPQLAWVAIGCMKAAGIGFAVLHGFERLADDEVSDVDVVVDRPPSQVTRETFSQWQQAGLQPIVEWPYDIGGTATVFLVTTDATEGVQLDMLFDPMGVGKYRIRSSALLTNTEERSGAFVVSEPGGLIYEWHKRLEKKQAAALPSLKVRATKLDSKELLSCSCSSTGSPSTAYQLMGRRPPRKPLFRRPHLRLRTLRLINRLRTPVGFWVHVSEAAVAAELENRLKRILITVTTAAAPGRLVAPLWWISNVAFVRIRPGLFISYGRAHTSWPKPDLVVYESDIAKAASQVVLGMSKRLQQSA